MPADIKTTRIFLKDGTGTILEAQLPHSSAGISAATGFYKIATEANGHVVSAVNVTSSDITTVLGNSPVASASNATTVNGLTVSTAVPADAVFTDTVYTHSTYTANALGLYKVANDSEGHVTSAVAVSAADLTTVLGSTAVDSATYATSAGEATSFGGYTSATLEQKFGEYLPLSGGTLTGTTNYSQTIAATDSSTQIANTAFVQNAIDEKVAGGLTYKGTVTSAGDLPANHTQGDYYKVTGLTEPTTIAGQVVENGDVLICNTTGSAANNAHWDVVQGNMNIEQEGILYQGTTFSAGEVAVAGADGTVVTTGYTISKSVPADAVFTDTHYNATLAVASTAAGTANTATANATTYVNLVENGSASGSVRITGTSGVSVAATGGVITITGDPYTHSTYTSNAVGLYKVGNDAEGHVNAVSAVTKDDITSLGIPAEDTHYTANLKAGTSGAKSNATTATTNATTYLNLVENDTVNDAIQVTGAGAVTVTTANGAITVSAPVVTDTHYSATAVLGTSGAKTNATTDTTNTTTYLNLVEDNNVRSALQIKGAGAATVSAKDGVLTVSAENSTYSAFTSATSAAAGTSGLVPAPAAGDQAKVLTGNAQWTSLPEHVAVMTTEPTTANTGDLANNSIILYITD